MKKTETILISTILTLIFLVSGFKDTRGQNVNFSSYIEHGKHYPKAGSSATIEFNNNFEIGGFYQKAFISGEANPRLEQEFYGMVVGLPFISTPKFSLKLMARAGVVNKESFTITPSLESQVFLVKFLGIKAGVGVRNLSPTILAGFTFRLNGTGNQRK